MNYTNFRFFLICPPKPLVYKFTENTFSGERAICLSLLIKKDLAY